MSFLLNLWVDFRPLYELHRFLLFELRIIVKGERGDNDTGWVNLKFFLGAVSVLTFSKGATNEKKILQVPFTFSPFLEKRLCLWTVIALFGSGSGPLQLSFWSPPSCPAKCCKWIHISNIIFLFPFFQNNNSSWLDKGKKACKLNNDRSQCTLLQLPLLTHCTVKLI